MLRHALACLATSSALMAQFVLPLSPRDTFLRTSSDPAAIDSPAIPILSLGVQAGDWLRLRLVGDYSDGVSGDVRRDMTGVFAGSDVLQPATQQFRLTAPVAAGTTHVTPHATAVGNLPMDIPQDFWIARTGFSDEVTIRVPAGATFLFFTVLDSFYGDNSDPDFDLGVEITLMPAPAYPGTGGEDLILGTAVGGPLTLAPVKTATAGSTVTAAVMSPLSLLAGTSIVLILADVLPTGAPPIGPLPGTWCSPAVLIALVDVLQPGLPSNTLAVPIPTGFAGYTLWLQGGALWPDARNGLYVTAEAHEIQLL